ncbi:MAG: hypothetical protein QOI38_589 [Sphingomonadales bacterium]|jgi:drug/metabolite transporter (DMT)-like permease|nr:hypothetical protein [Sphingomonadales bacterium]
MGRFIETVTSLVPDVLFVMTEGPLGWLTYLIGLIFMFLTLRSLWKGRIRRFFAVALSALVIGILGYFYAFTMHPSYEAMAVLFFSAFIVIVAVVTVVLGLPVHILGRLSARRIEEAEAA